MAGTCFIRLIMLVLCFSYIVHMNGAIPLTRTANLSHYKSSGPDSKVVEKENTEYEKDMRRMEMEVNDYPGSGANNRHTPRSQLGRGCVDC